MSFVARRQQSASGRTPAEDRAQKRHAWRSLAEAGQRLAQRVIDTDGRESLGAPEFQDALRHTGKLRWEEAGDCCAAAANAAFIMLGNAVLTAGTDRRRAIMALGLAGAASALDQLLTEQGDRDAALWKRQTGES